MYNNNAVISFVTNSGGGWDPEGNPIHPVDTKTDYIPCNLDVKSKQYQIYKDGMYIEIKASIYVGIDDIPDDLDVIEAKNVEVKDWKGNYLNTFLVQDLEYLLRFNVVKILV